MAKSRPAEQAAPLPAASIESLIAADHALAEIAEIEALTAKHNADLERKVRVLNDEHQKKLFTEDGVAFADRLQVLGAGLETFYTDHKDEFLTDDKKSHALNHGVIGARQIRATLEALPKGSAAGSATLLDKLHAYLVEHALAFAMFKKIPTTQAVQVQVSFVKPALLKARQDELITVKELEKAGFTLAPAYDKFFFKPTEQVLESHPSA